MTSNRVWDRWLLLVGWGLVVFGLLLALLNRSWVFEQLLNRPVDAAFWPDRVEGVQRFQARHPFPRRQRWAWNCLCSGMTLWYVLDTSISIAFGVYVNAP